MKANTILETIGNTPVVKINHLYDSKAHVWMKMEKANPGGSIKDRIARTMIEEAESKGLINKDTIIVEPTSGNTGVGLAMVCAVKGYKLILVMPESMSIERRKLMAVYGATFELTPREVGMKGAIAKAEEIIASNPNAWMPMQFDNQANVKAHLETTAMEIINDFPEGIDYLITGVGTGGHITGVARALKKINPGTNVLAVEPDASPVISGGEPGPHPLQGIGAGFIPSILDSTLLDGTIQVGREEAYRYAQRLVKEEGIFAGISTGASCAAVAKKWPEIPSGTTVVTFNYDTGERYFSVEGLYS